MARHPQNSPRGLFAKTYIDGNAKVELNSSIKISALQEISGRSTGLVWADNSTVGAIPGNKTTGVDIGVMTNSTGTALFINLTGTTHKYLNVTTKQPT